MRTTASNSTVIAALLGGRHLHRLGNLASAFPVAALALVVERFDAGDVERLGAIEFQRRRGFALGELQRDHAHADQVRAVNTLERFGDDRAHAEQAGALGRPVARRARPVLLAAEHDQRDVLLRVVLRGVVDERLLTVFGEVAGVTAGHVVEQLVAQADVGERAADHHLVVAAPRAVGVVVRLLHAVRVEVLRGGGATP